MTIADHQEKFDDHENFSRGPRQGDLPEAVEPVLSVPSTDYLAEEADAPETIGPPEQEPTEQDEIPGPESAPLDKPLDQAPVSEAETEITTERVIEAVLFASDEPITAQKLAEIVDTAGVKEIKNHITRLNQKYDNSGCAFRIEAIAEGFQMLTRSAYNVWLHKLLRARSESKLSQAALETLAIIAYKQPVLRVEVEAIRGVGCGEMIRQLCEKGLVKIVGRAEVIGRPLLYGTTRRFLQVFGINSLKDLPQAQELKEPG